MTTPAVIYRTSFKMQRRTAATLSESDMREGWCLTHPTSILPRPHTHFVRGAAASRCSRERRLSQRVMAAIRQHMQSFLLGGVTSLGFGYYFIHQDVWSAAEAVDSRLASLGGDMVAGHKALQKRVGALEGEITKLKGELAAVQKKDGDA